MNDNGDNHACKCSGVKRPESEKNCVEKLTRTSHLFLGEGQHILILASGGTDRVLIKAHNGGLILAGGRPAKEVVCGELFPRAEAKEL